MILERLHYWETGPYKSGAITMLDKDDKLEWYNAQDRRGEATIFKATFNLECIKR